ncbi:veficolin-1-like [Gigantopelta aegis]|uniref:veficolin-1-like n=1 Tax=Gigantopelta aegis TaxID=1735272 RepID=UPI001B88D195|nr:veficolin-1-like [Gigantopelta aegis]
MKCLTEQRNKLKKKLDQCLSSSPISDCWDVKTRQNQNCDGTYMIDSPAGGKMKVRCDMTTDNGGWLTFVRRVKGGVDFNRPWKDYKHGFGDLAGDFWLGNDFLHMFTAAKIRQSF